MATNHFATFRAFPEFFLFSKKVLQSMFFNVTQIFNHAHPIAFFIPVVKGFQPVAWKASTLITVSYFTIQ